MGEVAQRARVQETVAMKISGHRTRAVFDRYNITSEEDLRAAADRLDEFIQQKTVTITVTNSPDGQQLVNHEYANPSNIWRRGWAFESPHCFERVAPNGRPGARSGVPTPGGVRARLGCSATGPAPYLHNPRSNPTL